MVVEVETGLVLTRGLLGLVLLGRGRGWDIPGASVYHLGQIWDKIECYEDFDLYIVIRFAILNLPAGSVDLIQRTE